MLSRLPSLLPLACTSAVEVVSQAGAPLYQRFASCPLFAAPEIAPASTSDLEASTAPATAAGATIIPGAAGKLLHIPTLGGRSYALSAANNQSDGAAQDAYRAITRRIRDAYSIQQVQDIVQESASSFNAIHTSAALHKAAKLAGTAASEAVEPLLQQLTAIWQAVLTQASTRELSNCLWACAKLSIRNSELWSSSVAAAMRQLGPDANGQDLSNLAYSLAVIADLNLGAVPGISKQATADVLARVTELLVDRVSGPAARSVSVQSIINVLWADAKLQVAPAAGQTEAMLQALAQRSAADMGNSSIAAQGIANALWAVSELQELSGTGLKVQDIVWKQMLSPYRLLQLAAGGPRSVSSTLRALGQLATADGHTLSVPFAQQCAAQLVYGPTAVRVGEWGAVDIAAALWGCGKIGVKQLSFLQAAAAGVSNWLPSATASNVNQITWACAKLRFRDPQLLEALMHRGKQLMHHDKHVGYVTPSSQERADLATTLSWAAAVLNLPELSGDVKALLVSSGIRHMQEPLSAAVARMLWRLHTWLLHEHLMGGHGLTRLLTEQQLAACAAATRHHSIRPTQNVIRRFSAAEGPLQQQVQQVVE